MLEIGFFLNSTGNAFCSNEVLGSGPDMIPGALVLNASTHGSAQAEGFLLKNAILFNKLNFKKSLNISLLCFLFTSCLIFPVLNVL